MQFNVLIASADPEFIRQQTEALEPISNRISRMITVSRGTEMRYYAIYFMPHIIITDAMLPYMSPFAVLNELHKSGLRPAVICIDKEKDPDRLYEALRAHVDEYFLRPVIQEELCSAVSHLMDMCEESSHGVSQREYRKIIGKLFLDKTRIAMADNQYPPDIVNNLYDTHFKDGLYRMVVICMDLEAQEKAAFLSECLSICADYLYDEQSKLCHEVVMRFARKRIHVLLNYAPENSDAVTQLLQHRLNMTTQILPTGIKVNFCCSFEHTSIQEIEQLAEESMDAAWSRFTAHSDGIHTKQKEPCPEYLVRIYDAIENELKSASFELDVQQFKWALEKLFSLPDHIVGRCETRQLLRRIEFYILDVNKDLISAMDNLEKVRRGISNSIQNANTLEEYKHRYLEELVSLFRVIVDMVGGRQSRHIRLAKQYIADHLSEPLRLKNVADSIGISAVYLSTLFSQNTEHGFSDYVMSVRVDEGKKLLKDHTMKIQAIASCLGFCDARYFSRTFKAKTGLTPKEYRAALRQDSFAF